MITAPKRSRSFASAKAGIAEINTPSGTFKISRKALFRYVVAKFPTPQASAKFCSVHSCGQASGPLATKSESGRTRRDHQQHQRRDPQQGDQGNDDSHADAALPSWASRLDSSLETM